MIFPSNEKRIKLTHRLLQTITTAFEGQRETAPEDLLMGTDGSAARGGITGAQAASDGEPGPISSERCSAISGSLPKPAISRRLTLKVP
ncbi:hypothetical protein AAFF_G00404870 [Aldrovandia affinis]|uniref:Uncharacterized protein n=1 Tax=Aldrovandia affinis TaxID=143900 RepID=A0AAD7T7Z3_9TELE|nr:hypothetical protein AAFF_G00404870 [Aldrovandia affinis]